MALGRIVTRALRLLAGALLLLVALRAKWVAAGAVVAVLCLWALQRRARRRVWFTILFGAVVGGAIGAMLEGSELRPPGPTLLHNLFAMLRSTLALGFVEGGILVGGGVALVHSAFRPAPGEAEAAPESPACAVGRVLGAALRWLRPFRLAALLFAIAYAPILSSQLRSATRGHRAAMHADLRSLAYFEAQHFTAHGTFTRDLAALAGFRPSENARLTVEHADSATWRARAGHPQLTTTCTIGAGAGALGVAAEPDDPVCHEARRWF